MAYNKYTIFYTKTAKKSGKPNFWFVVVVIILGLFLFYCNIRPQDTGVVGRNVSQLMNKVFGVTRFFIPFVLFYWLWYMFKSKLRRLKTDIVLTILIILLLSATVKVVLKILNFPPQEVDKLSGFVGSTIYFVAENVFGPFFGSVLIVLLLIYIFTVLFELSIVEMVENVYNSLVEDVKHWVTELSTVKKGQQRSPVSRYEKQRSETVTKIEKQTITVQQKVDTQKTTTVTAEPEHFVTEVKKTQPPTKKATYTLPTVDILEEYPIEQPPQEDFEQNAKNLENVLKEFDINAKVVNISPGPVVTLYEIELEPGVKLQSVYAIKDNIALRMKTSSIHINGPLPGRGTIGIEIPNKNLQIVPLRKVLQSKEYKEMSKKMKLPIVLGETIDGKIYVDDIVPMPHMLIAGATGSGKSVCIHSIIMSLLFRCYPDELKLVLIDPKRLELLHYNGIPHLYNPNCDPQDVKVITTAKEAANVLSSLVKVMEQRYEKFAAACVRNIESYNEQAKSRGLSQEFYIVVIIDEFADLILTVPKEVEDAIQRLAQMARAVGIHLILATQRPSVDVITGVIKANFSCRIAFQVLSKTDSRVILDIAGAEDLLGRGDMLYLPTGAPKPIRLQGVYVSEKDIENVVNFIKSQNIPAQYEPITKTRSVTTTVKEREIEQKENLYSALVLIKQRRRVSQDLLKAHFRSSSKASDILSLLEVYGFIYKPEGTNRWSINFDRVEEAIKNYEQYKDFKLDQNNS